MAVWVVRAGERNKYAETFVERGVIAVGWEVFTGDWNRLSRDDILDVLLDAGAEPAKAAAYREEILDFRDRMAVGDLVVTPDPPDVLVGEITGPDVYDPDAPFDDYRQLRTVTWLGTWPRDQLTTDMRSETSRRNTVTRQDQFAEQWFDIARRIRAGQGGQPGVRARPERAARPTTPRSGSAPRSKAAPKPKVAVQAQLLCPSCGYRMPASRFEPGSDVCTDCA